MTLPLTPSIAPPLSGLQDLISHLREEAPGPPLPVAPSKATRFTDPERLPSRANPASHVCAMHSRAPPPISANLYDPQAQPWIDENPGFRQCPSGQHHQANVIILAEPRRPSVNGSGPDRLSPHRRPSNRVTHKEPAKMDFTPIRLAWTPYVANSWFYRLDEPISPRMLAHPLSSSPRSSRAHGSAALRLEFPSRACFRKARGFPTCLHRPLSGKDRLTRSLAKGSAIRCAQGVFRPEEHSRRLSPPQ